MIFSVAGASGSSILSTKDRKTTARGGVRGATRDIGCTGYLTPPKRVKQDGVSVVHRKGSQVPIPNLRAGEEYYLTAPFETSSSRKLKSVSTPANTAKLVDDPKMRFVGYQQTRTDIEDIMLIFEYSNGKCRWTVTARQCIDLVIRRCSS